MTAPLAVRPLNSVNNRKAGDPGLFCSLNQGISRCDWGKVTVDRIKARLDRNHVILAVISGPAADEHVCGIPKRSDHNVLFVAAGEEANGGKLMRAVPIHYGGSLHRRYISNLAISVPAGGRA